MIEIFELKDKIEYFDQAVHTFWDQWGTPSNFQFYNDCMLHSCHCVSELPRFYIALQNNFIIGTYALLRNDLISRQDLFPWLACLYVKPEFRGNKIGAELMEHAIRETEKKGMDRLYLTTDLDGYYEKYGWVQIAKGYMFDGKETKIYATSTLSNEQESSKA